MSISKSFTYRHRSKNSYLMYYSVATFTQQKNTDVSPDLERYVHALFS